ncbi:DUF4097 family beta strand repeat-containing protein [Companilactobacillus kimchiensis]|uniref:Uncharacterized protein n=1 Tax=Companilactobacillus kimchiensis TaxID=993692 RepID=A0A0R2LLP5_9LACO|nr:DUF4097 family beta strand repeat-containing protein [Companilactobacillus kimchiensis]KRN99863.1 hypothetical protein IV57_GL002195 [Companilactobacillus kimchiensis]
MRKYFVTGFYLLIVGGILLLGGFVMGGNRSVIWDHGFKVAQKMDETYPLSNFNNIYIEGRDTNVNLKLGDRYKIHVDGDKSQVPTYKVKDGTLTISGGEQKNDKIGVNVLGRTQITVTIPMNKALNNVNVRLADGTMRINDVTIDHLVKTPNDMDYDSSLYLNDVTVHNLDKINLYNDTLGMNNSKISNMTLIASADSIIKADSSTITNSNINLDESSLNIKQSNLDSIKSLANHSKVSLTKTTLMNQNKFRLLTGGRFTGNSLTVDGLDLTTEKGIVRYFDKSYGNNYQDRTDATNLLDVKATKSSITIK